MSAPPLPHTPSNSHFVRRVKLRLAYRLAFVKTFKQTLANIYNDISHYGSLWYTLCVYSVPFLCLELWLPRNKGAAPFRVAICCSQASEPSFRVARKRLTSGETEDIWGPVPSNFVGRSLLPTVPTLGSAHSAQKCWSFKSAAAALLRAFSDAERPLHSLSWCHTGWQSQSSCRMNLKRPSGLCLGNPLCQAWSPSSNL